MDNDVRVSSNWTSKVSIKWHIKSVVVILTQCCSQQPVDYDVSVSSNWASKVSL